MLPSRYAALIFLLLFAAMARADDWKLVWSDEFNTPGLPDPAKWDYEVGFIRNNEQQYYTKARTENARVEDGHLVIEGRKEQFKNPLYDPNAKGGPATRPFLTYTSASITTKGKFNWTYGRIEMRAKLPHGKGVWPAFWMVGKNHDEVKWPACGEIDIMEFVGHTPDMVHGTMHWQRTGKHVSLGDKLQVSEPWKDFHIYAVEWSADKIDVFYDDKKYFSFDVNQATESGDNAFRKPMYLILNLALGGSWGRTIDDSIMPQPYLIDYVRVYQKMPATKSD